MIKIKGDKIFYIPNTEPDKEPEQISSLSYLLGDTVELEDVTFGQFFQLIYNDYELMEVVFHIALGGHSLNSFYEDLFNSLKINETKYEKVYISWNLETFGIKEKDFYITSEFYGSTSEEPCCGLSFTPLYEIRDCLLELDSTVVVREFDEVSKTLEERYSLNSSFTLYDIIHAIFFEITFTGYPEQRTDLKEELYNRIDQVKSGKVKLHKFEDIVRKSDKSGDSSEEVITD